VKRNPDALKNTHFDLLVIGGGIYGVWSAFDAALRGLKVALIEKKDWASATSSSSSKLIHGGFRYLENLRFGLVKKSLKERKLLNKLAPHQVRPLTFLLPLYKAYRLPPWELKAGLFLYDMLAGKNQPVKRHSSMNPRETLKRYPFLKPEGLLGTLTYGDCGTDDARFVTELVAGAIKAGVVAVNYVEALELLSESHQIVGAKVLDTCAGETFEIRAAATLNAAGPWIGDLIGDHSFSSTFRLDKGVHLLLPGLPTGKAMLIISRSDDRIFFMIPWYGKTLVGTTDTDYSGDPDKVAVSEADIDYLLEETRKVIINPQWDRSSILGKFAGLRTLIQQPGKSASKATREWSLLNPKAGLFVSVGGKFTSARVDAESIIDQILPTLPSKQTVASTTSSTPFPWSPGDEYKIWKDEMLEQGVGYGFHQEMFSFTLERFGTSIESILDLARNDPSLAELIHPDLPFFKAELVHCATSEMVIHLEDLLRRRIPLTILSTLDLESLQWITKLIAPVLGWDQQRQEEEISTLFTAGEIQ